MESLHNIVNAIQATTASPEEVPDDCYIGDDGLWYCKKCRTPRQVKISGVVHYCMCDCEAERYQEEEARRLRQEKIDRLKRQKTAAFPEPQMAKMTFDVDDHQNEWLSGIGHKYVNEFDKMRAANKGLLLYGPPGTGKTFVACCIANELVNHYPVLATSFSRIANQLSGMYDGKQEYLDSLNQYELLVIDDLNAERNTEYMNEIVFNVIDSRHRSGKPIIVTTNLTGEELQSPSDIKKERIYSRLFEMCIPINVTGDDRRQISLKTSYSEMAKLLGI